MGPRYGVALFYGLILYDEDLLAILKRAKKFSAAESQMDGFNEADWYSNALDELKSGDNLEPFLEPVCLRSLAEPDETISFCLTIQDLFFSVDECVFSFELEQNLEQLNLLLKGACDECNITWREPMFHLRFDYYYGYWKWSHYDAILFYGIVFEDLNGSTFVKVILKNYRNALHQANWDYYDYMGNCVFREISAESLRRYHDSYNAEKESNEMSWEALENCIFESQAFEDWIPNDKTISEILCPEVIQALNKIWNGPITIGSIINSKGFLVYLGMTTTCHYPSEGTESFHFAECNKKEWDNVLKTACEKYGLDYHKPSWYILHDDEVG